MKISKFYKLNLLSQKLLQNLITCKPNFPQIGVAVMLLGFFAIQNVYPQTFTWSSPPDNLSTTGQDAQFPQIAVTGDGTKAVAVWARNNGTNVIIESRVATINGSAVIWGSVTNVSAIGYHAGFPQIKISSDGMRATAVWVHILTINDYIIQSSSATISGNTISWGAITNLSVAAQTAYIPQVAISSDGTRATAVWRVFDGAVGEIQSCSATINGNTALWGTVIDLTNTGQIVNSPEIGISGDGTLVTAVWQRWDPSNSIIQTRSATINGNVPTWGAVTNLSAPGQDAVEPQIALSADGTKATTVWSRPNGPNFRIQTSSANITGNTPTWSSVTDISPAGNDAGAPQVKTSVDGTIISAVWFISDGSNYIIQIRSATAIGNNVSWSAVTDLSASGQNAHEPALAIAIDGTNPTVVWRRWDGNSFVIQTSSILAVRQTIIPRIVTDLSATGQRAELPQVAVSFDGTMAIAVWRRFDGSNYIIQSDSATIVYPTPTVTPTPTTTATPTQVDSTAPRVRAIKSNGVVRGKLQLRYRLSDNSGRSAESIEIIKKSKTLKTIRIPLSLIPSSGMRVKTVKTPIRIASKLKFCIQAKDPSGNLSAISCAALTIKQVSQT